MGDVGNLVANCSWANLLIQTGDETTKTDKTSSKTNGQNVKMNEFCTLFPQSRLCTANVFASELAKICTSSNKQFLTVLHDRDSTGTFYKT